MGEDGTVDDTTKRPSSRRLPVEVVTKETINLSRRE